MSNIQFEPRWKKELQAISSEGTLIFEFTAGRFHVYFPSKSKWETSAPAWAKNKYEEYFEGCTAWCKLQRFPITLVDDAHFYEIKTSV